jgi:hypothetical protein
MLHAPTNLENCIQNCLFFYCVEKSNRNETDRTKVRQKTSSYKLHLKSLRLLAVVFSSWYNKNSFSSLFRNWFCVPQC